MNYQFCSQTHTGQVRNNNEDAVAFDEATNLAILADGMGGYSAGEIASGMTTTFLIAELGRWLSEAGDLASAGDIKRAMEICVGNANRAVFNAARANPEYAGMGTTLIVAVFRANLLLLGHVGDSRCYCLRGTEFEQITKDHSLLQEQLDAGWLTPRQAANSPIKNLVTRAVGVEDAVLLELNERQVLSGDIYLMCSDGLSDMMEDAAMADILSRGSTLTQMADALVARANDNGGRDNISVLLVQALGLPEKRPLISRWLRKQ